MSRSELRHPSLRVPFRGVRVPAGLPDDLRTRCLAARLLLPGGAVFEGATAAALLGLPIPREVDPGLHRSLPLDVVVPRGGTRPRVVGLRVRSGDTGVPAEDRRLVVVRPARAWTSLGAALGLDDLVVLGDAVARRDGGLAAVGKELARPGRVADRATLGAALTLVRERVDSPQETRTRLLLVRAGLPEPEVNVDATADDGATWLATPDLGWHRVRVAVEYLGDVHRTAKGRWRKDVARREVLEDHGWKVLFATAEDLTYRRRIFVERVTNALRERGLSW